MVLTIYQKSLYLIIYNATMISRSIGKSLKRPKDVSDFRKKTFEEIEKLIDLMDNEELTESQILNSIENLSNELKVSFGQAQKPINVILKFHFHLTINQDNEMKKTLYCPIDSIILKNLKINGLPLTKIDKKTFLDLQKKIQDRCSPRIDFDLLWDQQHLKDAGI